MKRPIPKKELNAPKLPDLPSKLIRVALKDLGKIEKTPGYTVDMMVYHQPGYKNCMVCFAGAVMASANPGMRNKALMPANFPADVRSKLNAIDYFRGGNIGDALDVLPIAHTEKAKWLPQYVDIADYETDRKAFKADMRFLANLLEDVGL